MCDSTFTLLISVLHFSSLQCSHFVFSSQKKEDKNTHFKTDKAANTSLKTRSQKNILAKANNKNIH